MVRMANRVAYTLDSTLDSVNKVEQTAEQLAIKVGFGEDDLHKITMSVREAAVNAVLHGNAVEAFAIATGAPAGRWSIPRPAGPMPSPESASEFALSRDGRRLAIGSSIGTVRLWQLDGKSAPVVLPPVPNWAFVVSCGIGSTNPLNISAGLLLKIPRVPPSICVCWVAWLPRRRRVLDCDELRVMLPG